MSASLVGSLKILGRVGIRNSERTPSVILVDSAMTLRTPVLGVTVGFSPRENPSSLLNI